MRVENVHHLLKRHLSLASSEGGSSVDAEKLAALVGRAYEAADQRFDLLTSRVSDAILVTNAAFEVVSANVAAISILGYSKEAIIGQSLGTFLPELKLSILTPTQPGTALAEGEETAAQRCNGENFDAIVSIFALNVGQHGRRVCMLRDASEVRRAQRDGVIKGAQLRAVLDNMPHGVVMFDSRGKITQVNQQATNILEVDGEAVAVGTPFVDFACQLFPKFSMERIKNLAHRLRRRGRGTIELVRPSGKVFEARLGRVDDGGLIVGFSDVTLHKRTQHTADAAREVAEDANQAKSAFLAMMSHELRTPMNAVLGMAGLLARSDLDYEQSENVKTLIDAGDVLMSVLNDILDLSKIEADKLEVEEIDVDIRHTVRKLERLWRPNVEDKGLRFIVKIDDNTPSVIKGDPVRIRQILFNLLSNATKFTSNGEVVLHVRASPVAEGKTRVEFEVRDSGVGMTQETVGRLFSTFEQADGSITRRFGGTGLGLAISRKLACLMNGDVSVRSCPGEGSTFTLSLRAQVITASVPVDSHKPEQESKIKTGVRILAVEDNPINQRVLASFLRPVGGEITWAGHGEEALQMAEVSQFDVILMDIQMPVMDGLTATKELRAGDSINATTSIIAMTANAMMGDRETCLAAGMSDYISKPIDPRALYTAIAKGASASRARRKQQSSQKVA